MTQLATATDRQTEAEQLQRLANRWEELDAAITLSLLVGDDVPAVTAWEEERREVARQYRRLTGI